MGVVATSVAAVLVSCFDEDSIYHLFVVRSSSNKMNTNRHHQSLAFFFLRQKTMQLVPKTRVAKIRQGGGKKHQRVLSACDGQRSCETTKWAVATIKRLLLLLLPLQGKIHEIEGAALSSFFFPLLKSLLCCL
jgi:hypothetical protein